MNEGNKGQNGRGTKSAPTSGSVFLSALWCGDRFKFMDQQWTVIIRTDVEITARKHSSESIELGERGYGYIGDSICSFDVDENVEFIPPNDNVQPRLD